MKSHALTFLAGMLTTLVLLLYCGAALAAVLGPLLLIYGFKFGIITALLGELEAPSHVRNVEALPEKQPYYLPLQTLIAEIACQRQRPLTVDPSLAEL